jgi:MYXO-CTERM domain-containing protein
LVVLSGSALAITAPNADAAVVFSNVTIGGSLAAGSSFLIGPGDRIDFTFITSAVGDVQASRSGNIVITYLARSDDLSPLSRMDVDLLGGIAGSGTMIFNEVIEDLNAPGIVASYGVTLGPSTPPPALPHHAILGFSHSTNFVKVKKTIVLIAPDSADPTTLDQANISLVSQTLSPTPGSLALLTAAGIVALRRRRDG